MTQPVYSLRSLCNLVNALQSYPLEVKHFSNFRDLKTLEDSARAFWNVLHNLTCDSRCEDIVQCTKLQFAKKSYMGLHFYALSSDTLNPQSNWELLLAFSWLICKDIIEEKLDQMILQLFDYRMNSNNQIEERNLLVQKSQENYELINTAKRISDAYMRHRYYESEKLYLHSAVRKKLSEKCPLNPSLIITLYCQADQSESVIRILSKCKDLVDLYTVWKTQDRSYFKWIKDTFEHKEARSEQLFSDNSYCKRVLLKNKLMEFVTKIKGVFRGYEENGNAFQTYSDHLLRKIIDILNMFGLAALK